MESNETGSGAAETTETTENQGTTAPWLPEGGEQKPDDAPSWAKGLMDRFDQLAPKQEEETDEEEDYDLDLDEEETEEDEGADLTPEDLQVLQQMTPEQLQAMGIDPAIVFGPMADPAVREMAERLQALEQRQHTETARQEEARRDAEAEALEQLYPDLQKPEVAEKVINAAERLVRQMRPNLTPDDVRDQALEPSFLELVYKAQLADERAAGETPATRPRVGVEHGGGANPDDAEDAEAQIRKGIVNASRGGSPFNF